MTTSFIVKLAFILLCIAVAMPSSEAEITCGVVTEKLIACLGYLQHGQGPTTGCCSGVRSLHNMAATVDDRRAACRCMKSAAVAVPSILPAYAASLPGKCDVSLPSVAGANTDCSKIN